jgi:hypothetical protein
MERLKLAANFTGEGSLLHERNGCEEAVENGA